MNDNAPGNRLRAMTELAMRQAAIVGTLTERLEDAQAALTRTLRTDLPELMKELGMSEATLPELGVKVAVTGGVDISIPEQQRSAAYAWMAEQGYGALVRAEVSSVFGAAELERAQECARLIEQAGFEPEVKMAVPPPTLKAWARERLEAGADIPPTLFNVRAYDMARITNSKRKQKGK